MASERSALESLVEHILNGGSASDERIVGPFAEPGPSSAQGRVNPGGPRRERSRRRNDLTSSVDARKRPTPAAHSTRRADEQKINKMKGFDDWLRTSNSGIESWWRLKEKTGDDRCDTLHIGTICNMEHSRERSRVERDEELHLKKRREKGREGWAKRDERIQAIFQRLDSDLGRAASIALPGR